MREAIPEKTYSMEELDAIAKSLEVTIISVENLSIGEQLIGKVTEIKPKSTDFGTRIDFYGTLEDNTKFSASSWSCKLGKLKPSALLSAKNIIFTNKNDKKIEIALI